MWWLAKSDTQVHTRYFEDVRAFLAEEAENKTCFPQFFLSYASERTHALFPRSLGAKIVPTLLGFFAKYSTRCKPRLLEDEEERAYKAQQQKRLQKRNAPADD